MILDFQLHNLTVVEELESGLWRITLKAEDSLFCATVILEVKAPALDIRFAKLEVTRDVFGLVPELAEAEKKLIGVRVGPGMTKIVREIVGGANGSDRIAELLLEAMEMLVNAITVPELRKATELGGTKPETHGADSVTELNDRVIGLEMIRKLAANPRLKDSCAAFKGLD